MIIIIKIQLYETLNANNVNKNQNELQIIIATVAIASTSSFIERLKQIETRQRVNSNHGNMPSALAERTWPTCPGVIGRMVNGFELMFKKLG